MVLILFLYLAAGLSFAAMVPIYNASEIAARQYTAELEGAITDSTFRRMDEIQSGPDEAIAAFDTAEKQSGMGFLLASTERGRGRLLRRKIGMAAILTTAVWGIVYGLELHALVMTDSLQTLTAPVQNLAMLENFPLHIPIGGFLALLYASRLFILFGGAMVVLLLSSLVKQMEVAYIVCCAVLLPSMLYHYAGIALFRYLSLALGVEAMPLLLNSQGRIGAWVLCMAAVALLGGLSVFNLSVLKRRREV